MVYRPSTDPTLCFALMPFKVPFNDYYEEIIKPAAKDAGLNALRSDEIYGTKPVIRDIWEQIWKARAVIADVTTKNPNVNYELGMCHTLGVPTVIITQRMEDVPFDYQHRRCIVYDTTKPHWDDKLRHVLTETLKTVLAEPVELEELRWPYDTHAIRSKLQPTPLWSSSDAIDVVISGVRLLTASLGASFGPNGGLVSVSDPSGDRRQVKDAASIAVVVRSGDPLESAGVRQMQALIRDMYDSAGDYAKTAVFICERLLMGAREAQKGGTDLSTIVGEITATAELAVTALRKRGVPATDPRLIEKVALTAACGDHASARIVTEALKRAGKDGAIYTELVATEETQLETVEGMYFDRGYIDEGFVTDESTGTCTLSDCYILLYERKLSSIKEMLPVLELVARASRSILVIAEDVEGEALATLLVNKQRGTLHCAARRAPGYGDRRRAMLEDIATSTGGKAITVASGLVLGNVNIDDLGRAAEVVITKTDTSIGGGAGRPEMIAQRVRGLRKAVEREPNPMEREKLQEPLARLSGAVVALRVGGATRTDALFRRYRVTSAMHSARMAVETGYAEGGGVALHQVRVALEEKASGISPGRTAVFDALDAPLRQLIATAGLKSELKIADGQQFDVRTSHVVDVQAAGIFDPVGSLCKAIELASIYAITMLQTGAWDLGEPISLQHSPSHLDQTNTPI